MREKEKGKDSTVYGKWRCELGFTKRGCEYVKNGPLVNLFWRFFGFWECRKVKSNISPIVVHSGEECNVW